MPPSSDSTTPSCPSRGCPSFSHLRGRGQAASPWSVLPPPTRVNSAVLAARTVPLSPGMGLAVPAEDTRDKEKEWMPPHSSPATHPGSTGSSQHSAALTGSGVGGCPWRGSESSGRCWQQLPGVFPHLQSTAGGELGGEGISAWDHPQIPAQGCESSQGFGGCRAQGAGSHGAQGGCLNLGRAGCS